MTLVCLFGIRTRFWLLNSKMGLWMFQVRLWTMFRNTRWCFVQFFRNPVDGFLFKFDDICFLPYFFIFFFGCEIRHCNSKWYKHEGEGFQGLVVPQFCRKRWKVVNRGNQSILNCCCCRCRKFQNQRHRLCHDSCFLSFVFLAFGLFIDLYW